MRGSKSEGPMAAGSESSRTTRGSNCFAFPPAWFFSFTACCSLFPVPCSLLRPPAQDHRRVVAVATECIHQRNVALKTLCLVRQTDSGSNGANAGSRRQALLGESHRPEQRAKSPRSAERLAQGRLGSAHRNLPQARAKNVLERPRFHPVPGAAAAGGGNEAGDLGRPDPGRLQGDF